MITRFWRRWFGGIKCVSCGQRIDQDVPWLGVASPSKLQVDHWPDCPARRSIMEACAP